MNFIHKFDRFDLLVFLIVMIISLWLWPITLTDVLVDAIFVIAGILVGKWAVGGFK